MANTGVQGRVVFTGTTNGIPGLRVKVVDVDAVPDEQLLGRVITDATGHFSIIYSPRMYQGSSGITDWNPDIVVRIYDQYLRLLHETIEYKDISSPIFHIPTISLHRDNVDGWLVTNALINPGGTPVTIRRGNRIEFFIDNENGWSEMTDAVGGAASSINLMMLDFDVSNVVTKFTPPMPPPGSAVSGVRIQDSMKLKAGPGVAVRVLMNDFNPDAWGNMDAATEVTDFFNGTGVVTRLYTTRPQSPMHAKLLIIDGSTAFLVGSPFLQDYWDSQTHIIDDTRRAISIKKPIHEVSAKIRGPAVEDIDRTFTMVWNYVAPTEPPARPATGQSSASGANVANVQVVRTLPGGKFPSIPHGETGILEAYQRAIAKAEDFIYIENQYFSNTAIADALLQRLKFNTNLTVILLLNIKVDVPGYFDWPLANVPGYANGPLGVYSGIQPRTIRDLLDGARTDGTQDRLGIFTLWSHEAGTPKTSIIQNYVHSKTAIIDDSWATVGSANTDGTSMNRTQVFRDIPTRADILFGLQEGRPTQHANPNSGTQPWRSTELNLAIYNGVAEQPATPIIGDLRRRLWAEHLGYSSSTDAALMTRPTGGWLSLWNTRAQEKQAKLTLPTPIVLPQRILPWAFPDNATGYLRALDIEVRNLNVIDP